MAEECMEIENTNREKIDSKQIIEHLVRSEDAYFKSQQRDEEELSSKQKQEIAETILTKSKANFLARFGKNLKQEHLEYFTDYVNDEQEGYEIGFYLSDLQRYFTKTKRETDIKNRRYDALKKLIDANTYFSETEMMKRNPLLYDQLVGRYLSEEERKTRDNIDTKNITFVNLLLESIDRDTTRKRQKQQQDDEAMEEEEEEEEDTGSEDEDAKDTKKESEKVVYVDDNSWDDEIPSTSRWGGFEDEEPEPEPPTRRFNFNPHALLAGAEPKSEALMITAPERQLLKAEFTSIMYQSFLDGKDADFDYTSVDDNDAYDNLDIRTHDAEESYFDSETPHDDKMASSNETSDDELDLFMQRLNQHHTLQMLSDGVKKLCK